jgi:hypothetical protein
MFLFNLSLLSTLVLVHLFYTPFLDFEDHNDEATDEPEGNHEV